MKRRILLSVVFVGLAAGGLGCGTDTVVQYPEDVTGLPDEGEGVGVGDHVVFPDAAPEGVQPDKWISGSRYEIILLHDTSQPLPMFVGEHEPIRVKVIDYALNEPAAFYPVQYVVVGANPECTQSPPCGQFLVKEATTDTNGMASVTFEAGTQEGIQYTVEVDGEQAVPATMDIQVNALPKGTLAVHLSYEGPIEIHGINVRVSHANVNCQKFNAVAPWTADIDGQKTVAGINSTLTFKDLPCAETYLVFATALGPSEHLAAAGCIDAIHVMPQEQGNTDVTLKLYVLTLNPAGTYDTVNHFDFTGAIPGQAGQVINLIVDLFYNPGKVIIDLVKELVSQYIGDWVTDAIFGIFEDALANVVTDWLLNNSPDFMQDFFTMGQDLVQIVKNVELTSTLKLSKLTNDYYFQGTQSWQGINLYWKLGCDKNDPNYAECGKYPFSLKDLQDTDMPIDLITGNFTGMIANYDNLIIDTHKIDLNYGKLILFVINEMLLPAVSDFNSIEDLLYSLINCQAVADGIIGDVLEAIGVDKDQVKDSCTAAVGILIDPIEEVVNGLALDSKLRLSGKCRMLDDNDDLIVDKLFDGEWKGHVESGGEEGAEFTGDFTAVRAQYPGQ